MSKRWGVLHRQFIGGAEDPMLIRWWLVKTPYGGIYLHKILRADVDRALHDHPYWFASLILSGSYSEVTRLTSETADRARVRTWRRFSLHAMPLPRVHYIGEVDGPVWTLLLVGPHRRDWGFWTDKGFVPWRKFVAQQGSDR